MNRRLLAQCLVIVSILLAFTVQVSAQEAYLSADFPEADHQVSKQIARDKQLLEIWKDHVRTLTKERDEAYQKIRDLQTGEVTSPPAVVPVDSEGLNIALEEKERAQREAETLRSQVEFLKGQVSQLEAQGKKQQFSVEVQPSAPNSAPGSQKFYADLTKHYMLQQDMIKKQKEELASKVQTEAAAQKDYDRAIQEINELQSQAQSSKEWLETALSEKVSLEKGFESERSAFRDERAKKETEIGLLRQDRERSVREAAEAKLRSESLESKSRNLETANEKISAENRQVWIENEKLTNKNKDLNARIEAETERSTDYETRFKNTVAQAEEQREEAETTNQALRTQVETMENRLKTNASDIQNLKENFNTLLEPLVSSFDERK